MSAVVFTAVIDTIVAIFSGCILFVLGMIYRWGTNVEHRLDKIEKTLEETKKAVINGNSS